MSRDNKKFKPRYDLYAADVVKEARTKLNQILAQQKVYWRQRAKQFWLEEGDSNTKFFHRFTSARARKNAITHLKDKNGVWRSRNNGLHHLILEHFAELYKS